MAFKIKFLVDHEVKAANGPKYKAGQVVEVDQSHMLHFVKRNLAVRIDGDSAPETAAAEPAEEKATRKRGRPRKADL